MNQKLAILFVAMAALWSSPSTASDSVAQQARQAKPMSSADVRAIYENRTWSWGGGAGGYFGSERQTFQAVGREPGAVSWGEGTWFIPENGRLCMRATWRSTQQPSFPARKVTCFDHRQTGDTIYQRADGGDWYVFRHAQLRRGDEILKLSPGNTIKRAFERLAGA